MAALAGTALLQAGVVVASGSVALLSDTLHNLSDAGTALPLLLAFRLGRRRPSRRFSYGLGRAEDLAGIVIVAMIAASAVLAGWQAISHLRNPVPIDHLGLVAAAAIIGALGNEAVALYRIRVGRRIGSAALVADGLHARTDALTSLAVLAGAAGVALGWQWADPAVGLIIAGRDRRGAGPGRERAWGSGCSTASTPPCSTRPAPPPHRWPASRRSTRSGPAGSGTASTPTSA